MQDVPSQWPLKEDLHSPFRVAALVSKAASSYHEYKRSLTRGGADAVVIRLADNEANRRHYFEFFISPPGTFQRPATLLKAKNKIRDAPICGSLSERFVLVIRHLVLAESMTLHSWRPDVEIWFFARELEPDAR